MDTPILDKGVTDLSTFKPILFSTPMVRAILEDRKTMTRRVMNPQPPEGAAYLELSNDMAISKIDLNGDEYCEDGEGLYACFEYDGWPEFPVRKAKYQAGDILWVRETWYYESHMEDLTAGEPDLPSGRYQHRYIFKASIPDYPVNVGVGQHGWRPSIFMPREAARVFLQVTDVRVERVRDILCGDMRAEGCIPDKVTGGQWQQWQDDYFKPLWDKLNEKRGYGWDINPWVWVYRFERVDTPELLEGGAKDGRN
jgi:hypothetical protein